MNATEGDGMVDASPHILLMPFLVGTLIIGTMLESLTGWFNRQLRLLFPSTAAIMLTGVIVTALVFSTTHYSIVTNWLNRYTLANMAVSDLMLVCLPILTYDSAAKMSAYHVKSVLRPVVMLAIVGFIIAAATVSAVTYGITKALQFDTSPELCVMLGGLISATDPVAVVALLTDLGAPLDLSLIVEGESHLNDGMAVVTYEVAKQLLKKRLHQKGGPSAPEIIMMRLSYVAISLVFGWIASVLTVFFLQRTYSDSVKQRGIVLTAVYFLYLACEAIEGSGVLGLVVLGLWLNANREAMSKRSSADNDAFWGLLASWANALIFIHTGYSAAQIFFLPDLDSKQVGFALLFVVGVLLARAVSLLPIFAELHWDPNLKGRPVNSYTAVLFYGGLRGSVGLLLAQKLYQEEPLITGHSSPYGNWARLAVALTVLVSLAVQAPTAGYLLSWLKLTGVSEDRRRGMEKSIEATADQQQIHLEDLRRYHLQLTESDWDLGESQAEITDPYAVSQGCWALLKPKQN